MKKILAFVLALSMALALCACGINVTVSRADADTHQVSSGAADQEEERINRIDEVVCDTDGVVITILSVQINGKNDYTIRTELKNNTAYEVGGGHIIATSAYIDDTNIRIWWDGPSSVPAGKKASIRHSIRPSDFEEAGIDGEFEKLEFEIWYEIKGVTENRKINVSLDGKYFC